LLRVSPGEGCEHERREERRAVEELDGFHACGGVVMSRGDDHAIQSPPVPCIQCIVFMVAMRFVNDKRERK
jgi:hypothetical protein